MAKMNSSISRSKINQQVVSQLWGMSTGRCEMCNMLLYLHPTFGTTGNYSEKAHICGVGNNGPRHKNSMSKEEIDRIENLMLLCPACHTTIDSNPEEYSEGLLLELKKNHEARVRTVTEIRPDQTCRVVTYFSNIDAQKEMFDERLFKQALVKSGKVPLQCDPINLHDSTDTRFSPTKNGFIDKENALVQNFSEMFGQIHDKEAVAVFALAPQSLLIKLGTLINDQYNAQVFQCHRDGHKWAWKEDGGTTEFIVKDNEVANEKDVALVIDLSAEVIDSRITAVLGESVRIYHLTLSEPNRDFVTSRDVQTAFVRVFRKLMEDIKNSAARPVGIHLFPVMPNSLAVRLGMDYMPKADLPLIVYEQASAQSGFFAVTTIGGQNNDNT